LDIISRKEILQHVDHTLLAPTATWEELQILCDEAIKYETASVCVPPNRVKQVKDYLCGRMAVCTVVGFPNGYHTTAVKAMETEEVLDRGADEVDMVINLGWVKEKRFHDVRTEIHTLKDICDDKILKVIVETCFLTEEEKIQMCEVVTEAGADFIKTSTGFGSGGATFEDVALFAAHVGENVRIKAAGGIGSFEDAKHFLELGASRLGTSRLIKIMELGQ
jgi:deoxyribose-phosphate aldolase